MQFMTQEEVNSVPGLIKNASHISEPYIETIEGFRKSFGKLFVFNDHDTPSFLNSAKYCARLNNHAQRNNFQSQTKLPFDAFANYYFTSQYVAPNVNFH